MTFNESLVNRQEDGRFGVKEGLMPEVNLGPESAPPIPASLREHLAENELEYRIQRVSHPQRDELRDAYRGARSHSERRDRYIAIAEAHKAKSQRLFVTPRGRQEARYMADTARELADICEAHIRANTTGNVRVSTARSKARELTAEEAYMLHAELHEALRDGDPNGRIGNEFKTGGGRHFQLVYPDGSYDWTGQAEAEVLYKRLSAAYTQS